MQIMNQSSSDEDRYMEDDDDSGSNLDPRIGLKLEELNKWTTRINTLEKNFEEANSRFRVILSESTDRLKLLSLKLGKSIEDSRPFYEAKERLTQVQLKCQKAAINYEKACQAYLEAKERINLAEKKFTSAAHEFDTAWQEMLNQANIKLMEAETMKKESERLHSQSMKDFHSAEMVANNLRKKLKGPLHRSKVYFDEKKRFQKALGSVKEEIGSIISSIGCSKARYAATLRDLEAISEEIHEKRNCSLLKRLRDSKANLVPGVVGESDSESNSIEMVNSRLSSLGLSLSESGGYPSSKEGDGETEDDDEPNSSKSISSQASTSTDAMIYPANSCSDIDTISSINEDDHLQCEKEDSDSMNRYPHPNHEEEDENGDPEEDDDWKFKKPFIRETQTSQKDLIDNKENSISRKQSKDSFYCHLDSTTGLRKDSTPDLLNHIKVTFNCSREEAD